MMVDDEHPPDTAVRRPASLPPTGKIVREVFAGFERMGKELGLPVLCLLAAKWEIPSRELAGAAFLSAVSIVLGGNFALRRGETKEDR